jgi:hypothetical protein
LLNADLQNGKDSGDCDRHQKEFVQGERDHLGIWRLGGIRDRKVAGAIGVTTGLRSQDNTWQGPAARLDSSGRRPANLEPFAAEGDVLGLDAETGHCRYDDCDNNNDKRQRKRVIIAVVNRDRCLYRAFAEASRLPS